VKKATLPNVVEQNLREAHTIQAAGFYPLDDQDDTGHRSSTGTGS
jgi:hypothetical protein